MNLHYRVELSQAERDELKVLLSGGKHAVRKVKRAQILLAADAGASDEEIATSVGVGGSTVYRTKRRFVLGCVLGRDWCQGAIRREVREAGDRNQRSGVRQGCSGSQPATVWQRAAYARPHENRNRQG